MKGALLGEQSTFSLYFGFQWRKLPEALYFAIYKHALQSRELRLRLINNEEQFT
jgi:hypothetical protein